MTTTPPPWNVEQDVTGPDSWQVHITGLYSDHTTVLDPDKAAATAAELRRWAERDLALADAILEAAAPPDRCACGSLASVAGQCVDCREKADELSGSRWIG